MNSRFQFKQFSVIQSDLVGCKIGTDAVLLGAWVPLKGQKALDIGTGTGVIAMMLAQRSNMEIDAIEIEKNAYELAQKNFSDSPWRNRLNVFYDDIRAFKSHYKYDVIVSNPPFYSGAFSSSHSNRNLARHEKHLKFEELLLAVDTLLQPQGHFSLVIPYEEESRFLSLAENQGLFPHSILNTQGNSQAPIKRSFITLGRTKKWVSREKLIIEKERHVYTSSYIRLVKDFYLKM